MIAHNPTFETLATAPVKTTDVIVVRQTGALGSYADDNGMKWTSSTVLMSVSIDSVGEMLGAATKKAVVKLIGIVSGISSSELFQIRYGLYNGTSFEYVSQGFYKIDTIDYDYDTGSTTVTMYDHMWTAGKTLYADVVTSGDLEYPATVESFAEMIAGKLDLTLMATFRYLPNASYAILEDLYSTISNATLQNVVQEIAGATGTTARITDTTLAFVQYFPTTENLDSASLKHLKIGNSYGPINSVVLGRVPQNDNIVLYTQSITPKTVTANATTNLFTATDHRLLDGDLVQFTSTGTVPAPLVANTPYYVHTNANVNTFAVAPSYLEATQAQNSLSFDGTNDSVSVPHHASLNLSDNFSVFVKIKTTVSGRRVMNKWSTVGWLLETSSNNLRVRIYDGTNDINYITPPALVDGHWHTIGFTYTRGSTTGLKLYVDGVQVGTSQSTTAMTTGITNSSAVGIGVIPAAVGQYYQGELDEPMIFNKVLSPTEVSDLASTGSPSASPVLYFDLSEGTGTTLTDDSGTGNTGTISGATWVSARRTIDLTSAGTGTITVSGTPTQEIQINNNEILDDDRATLLPPLYDELSGVKWSEVTSDTVGLGWHEVGDVIMFTQGAITVQAFLNEVHLTLSGGVKENLVSKIPGPLAKINYSTAGGILKTLHNAEIKVDHQANLITSIVSEQQIINDQVQEDFTQIQQDIDSIDINIQNAGGNNLLQNSVGYATDQVEDDDSFVYGKLYKWDYAGINTTTEVPYSVATHGTVIAQDSAASQNLGGVSGRSIRFDANIGASKGIQLTQRVNVAVGSPLSFGVKVYSPGSLGTGKITLSNTNESGEIIINSSAHAWEEFTIENFITSLPWVDVVIEIKAEDMELTDLTLMYGVTIQKWTQADTEIMSTNVQFTVDGMRIFSQDGVTETRVTDSEFQVVRRSDGVILFEGDDTGVRANDFTIRGFSDYYTEGASVIKQITIPYDDPKGGIAFLKGTE